MSLTYLRKLGGVVVMMGAGLGPVAGQAAPVISLACLPHNDQTGQICAQLRAVIVEAQPGASVTIHAATDLPATGPAVTLHVETLKTFEISAHLEWRSGGSDWQRGETMSMSVMDRELDLSMIPPLLHDLWKRCPAGQGKNF